MKSGAFRLTEICIITCLFIILGCSNSNSPIESHNDNNYSMFEIVGLESQKINKITDSGNFIYAGTEAGLFKMDINDTSKTWNLVGLEQQNINTICIIDSLNFIIGVDSDVECIYRSSDGGHSWVPYTNGYGNGSLVPSKIISLDNAGQLLVSISQSTILKSDDNGQNWNTVWTDNSTETNFKFINQNPINNNDLWAGGQKADSTPLLLKSIDLGNSWERIHVYRSDTLDGVNICLNLVFHDELQNIKWLLYPTMIKETSNYGSSWFTSLAIITGYIADQIGIDVVNPFNLYVATRKVSDSFLNIYKSNDEGNNWSLLSDSAFDNNNVNDMIVINLGNINAIYLATDSGILKYIDSEITVYH